MDPVSMTMMALSAGVSAAGAMQQANAQKAAAEQQAQQYRTQAELQNRQANLEATSGQFQEARQRQKADAFAGQQLNMIAGSGFTTSGSATDVIIDSRREAELDAEAVRFGTTIKSDNLLFQSGVSQRNARSADNAASMAETTGILGAISPFISMGANLSGAGKYTKLGSSFGFGGN
jgi:hypothetical protein